MAAVEVPQTLEYMGGQLNVAPVLEVENFTNWKKRFMCHILGIEPQFENIIKNGPFIPMTAGQRNPEGKWTADERKDANLDQRLKSLIMSVLPDDQMNSVINCLTTKSTWDDLILYHEGPSDVKESRVMDLKLCYNTFKFKEGSAVQKQLTKLNSTNVARKVIFQETAYGKKGHFARDCWSKTSVSTYQSPFQPKPLSSPQHKPELRPTKDFEVKYNKVKAKLALLSLNASASKALWCARNGGNGIDLMKKQHVNTKILKENKNLRSELKELKAITKTWINNSNKVNQCISEQIPSQKKRIMGVDQLIEDPSSLGKKDLVFVKSSADDTKVTIPGVERPWLSEAEGFILPNYDTDYDSADKSSVCSTPLPPLKKSLLKGSLINEPSLAPAKGNKSSSALKVHSAPADKLKCVKIKDDPPLASVMKELNSLKLQVSKNQSSYSRISSGLALYKEEINLRNPQHAFKRCEAYGSSNHTTTDHYDIEWFRRGEALQAKKAEALKLTRAKSSKANRSKTPTKRWVSKRN
ncbi:hypothetical protein Tco_0163023 [Tanacetum coccineum]